MRFYDGARERICRLGLADVFLEVQQIIIETEVRLLESEMANSSAVVREKIDASFTASGGWKLSKSGDVDWVKRVRYNETILARLGVEVQVSARSDQLVRDLVHLRNRLQEAQIDAGVVIVPNDRMSTFLPDRTPALRDAIRIFEDEFKEAKEYPIIIMAVEHDGPGAILPKRITNLGKKSR